MHTITLKVQDSIYDHIMFLLSNLNTKKLEIIEDKMIPVSSEDNIDFSKSEVLFYSSHSANLIEEWKDISEDEIWK